MIKKVYYGVVSLRFRIKRLSQVCQSQNDKNWVYLNACESTDLNTLFFG